MDRLTINDLLEESRAVLARLEPADALAASDGGALLIDTRSADLRARDGTIPGSVHVPLSVLFWRLDPASGYDNPELSRALDRRVILVCDHGYSSSLAAATLRQLGFSNATDVVGGFQAWADAGLPVERQAAADDLAAACLVPPPTPLAQGDGTLANVTSGDYWQNVYLTRAPDDVGWYEPDPAVSRRLVGAALELGAQSVIDVGGGASALVDHLLDVGVPRIAVLDVAAAGLEVAKRRLGDRADRVEWIVGDVTTVGDLGSFDVWHDRAVFHFLVDPADRARYVALAAATVKPDGTAVVATFAPDGPERCSGLPVARYDEGGLAEAFGPAFNLLGSEAHTHVTPRGVRQAFRYFTLQRTP
jgi:rhodanese-related sulfurtransferase/SAM-dependent methyltransferase